MKLKKSLGQHLLNNPSYYQKILNTLQINKDDNIIEIGAGTGYFTKEILKFADEITVIEIDKKFCYILKNHFKEKIKIVHDDFLKVDLHPYIKKGKRSFILGNIPYYISGPVFQKCIEYKNYIYKFGLLIQKEFADKLTAKHNEKSYSAISVFFNLNFLYESRFDISRKSFIPPPKVDSTFLIFTPEKNIYFNNNEDYKKFCFFIKNLFNQKRKKISNSLKKILTTPDILEYFKKEFNLDLRVENYTLKDLLKIFEIFCSLKIDKRQQQVFEII